MLLFKTVETSKMFSIIYIKKYITFLNVVFLMITESFGIGLNLVTDEKNCFCDRILFSVLNNSWLLCFVI